MPEPIPAQESLRVVRLLMPVLFVLLSFGLYYNSLANPFIIDDTLAIENHPDVINPEGLWTLWTHDYWAKQAEDFNLYRPITVLSYHLNYRITGMSPAGFRVVNIALLAGVGCVAAMWMARYVGRACGWLAAVLLVIHPVNTELVNHVVGRADLLAVLGILGSLYTQKRAIDLGRWPLHLVFNAVLCAIVALGSKETGVLLVPLALIQAWIATPHDSRGAKTVPMSTRTRIAMWTGLIFLAVPALSYVVARALTIGLTVSYHSTSSDMISNPLRGVPFTQRLPGAMAVAWFNFRQVFLPDTSFNHVSDVLHAWSDPQPILGFLVLVSVVLAMSFTFLRRHWVCLGLTLALGQYLIVGNLLIPSGVYAANRLMLPTLVCAAVILANAMRYVVRHSKRRSAAAAVLTALVVLVVGWFVVRPANADWSSPVDRMVADLERHPKNPVAMFQLGVELARKDQTGQAIDWLQQVVAQRPDSPQARTTLGAIYLRRGNLDGARAQFAAVVERFPDDWQARIRLGEVCLLSHDADAAEKHILVARKLAPNQPEVLYNLAQLATVRGRYTEALRNYEALLIRFPNHALGRMGYEELKAFLEAQP